MSGGINPAIIVTYCQSLHFGYQPMPSVEQIGRTYQDLASWYAQKSDVPMRDRFLVLAADTLFSGGRHQDGEAVRRRLLELNPHHMLQPFASMAEAARSRDVRDYVDGLRRGYPPQAAEQLLDSLRGETGEHSTLPPLEPTSVRPVPPSPVATPAASWRNGWLDADGPDTPPGAWVCVALFAIMLAGGVILAGYVLAGPYFRP